MSTSFSTAPRSVEPVTEQVAAFLKAPSELSAEGFTVASQPPKITFSTVPGLEPLPANSEGIWTVFGEGVCSGNGRFYVAFGNNAAIDGNCCVFEYDPASHSRRKVLDMAKMLGQKPGEFGHGKLHGRLDETPDGWIAMATYCSINSEKITDEQRSRLGSRLVRLNTRTGEVQDLGMPVLGDTLPMNGTDVNRGIFHGSGLNGGYLAYDLPARRAIWQGPLPADIAWGDRSVMIDPNTGLVYSSEPKTGRIVSYDPHANRFARTGAFIPQGGKTEAHPGIRCYTRTRLPDHGIIAQTSGGTLFRFYPDELRTEVIGPNWLEGCYCPAMALTRDGRYLYYSPGTHGTPVPGGAVVVRMDTQTGARHVVAFLGDHYLVKHGYRLGTPYSISLDAKGEHLFLAWNGHFPVDTTDQRVSGEPAFMLLELPKLEPELK